MAQNLQGKVALVTGASRGIGRATALALASEGAAIVVNYASSSNAAEDVVAQIEAIGGRAIAFKANVANSDEVDQLISATMEKFGRIDVLVKIGRASCRERV